MPFSVAKNRKILPKIETNITNFEVWYTKAELPKIEITNIDVYQYRGIPVVYSKYTLSKIRIFKEIFNRFQQFTTLWTWEV